MIFHDRVTVHFPGEETGEYDDFGDPIVGPGEDKVKPATVVPSRSEGEYDARHTITQYQQGYAPPSTFEGYPAAEVEVTWQGTRYKVDGDFETHMIGRRIHHLEFMLRRETG